MKNLVVNIGLNVGNEEPTDQLQLVIDLLHQNINFLPSDTRIEEGQWETDEGVVKEYKALLSLMGLNIIPFLKSISKLPALKSASIVRLPNSD